METIHQRIIDQIGPRPLCTTCRLQRQREDCSTASKAHASDWDAYTKRCHLGASLWKAKSPDLDRSLPWRKTLNVLEDLKEVFKLVLKSFTICFRKRFGVCFGKKKMCSTKFTYFFPPNFFQE